MPHMALYKLKLLDEFEVRTDGWSFDDFQNRLMDIWRGATRQDAACIINAAHREGRWPRTVRHYLLSRIKVAGHVEPELEATFIELSGSLTGQERAQWCRTATDTVH